MNCCQIAFSTLYQVSSLSFFSKKILKNPWRLAQPLSTLPSSLHQLLLEVNRSFFIAFHVPRCSLSLSRLDLVFHCFLSKKTPFGSMQASPLSYNTCRNCKNLHAPRRLISFWLRDKTKIRFKFDLMTFVTQLTNAQHIIF